MTRGVCEITLCFSALTPTTYILATHSACLSHGSPTTDPPALHWLKMNWGSAGSCEGPRDPGISKPVSQLPLMNFPKVVTSGSHEQATLSLLTLFLFLCPRGGPLNHSPSSDVCAVTLSRSRHIWPVLPWCCSEGRGDCTNHTNWRHRLCQIPPLASNETGAADSSLSTLVYDSV